MIRLLSRIVLAASLLIVSAGPARAADKWILVATDHFDVVGNTSDSDIRRIAQTLEHFHDVVVGAVLRSSTQSGRATVLVFKDDISFTPYKPRGAGRGSVGGVFFLSETNPLLALDAENLAYAFRTVLNGYSRFIAASLSGDVPLWLSQGLGGVYETFEERNGGKGAMIGRPDANVVGFLKNATLLPVGQLTKMTRSSPGLVPGTVQRELYDAECWALVHYLSFGPRREQLAKYLASLHSGVPEAQAFSDSFGDPNVLGSEVSDYIRKFLFPALQVVFDEKVKPALPPRGEVLSAADAESFLCELVLRVGDTAQARSRLEKAVAATPNSARATAALANVEFADNKAAQGLSLLEKAAGLAPGDQRIQASLGRHLAYTVSGKGAARTTEDIQRARAALTRAVDLEPNDAVALAELGWMLLYQPDDPAKAEDVLTKAVTLDRGKDQYLLWLGDALVRQRKYDEGRKLLGPLMGRGSTPEIRAGAREVMANISRITQADARAASAGAPAPAAGGAPPSLTTTSASSTGPLAGSTGDGPNPLNQNAGREGIIPVLRDVHAGETRVVGTFSAVDCTGGALVFVVQTDAGVLNLAAKQFSDVTFLSYRQDTPTSVGCGLIRPAQRVLATYVPGQPAGAIAGSLVAIELIPDGFVPR